MAIALMFALASLAAAAILTSSLRISRKRQAGSSPHG